jgi:hypothetical protein
MTGMIISETRQTNFNGVEWLKSFKKILGEGNPQKFNLCQALVASTVFKLML